MMKTHIYTQKNNIYKKHYKTYLQRVNTFKYYRHFLAIEQRPKEE